MKELSIAIAKILKLIPSGTPPAKVIIHLIRFSGWELKKCAIPGQRMAMCDAWNRTLLVDRHFLQAVRYPDRIGCLQAQKLAHEFGHGIMHSTFLRRGERTKAMETMAETFAQRLLLPPEWIRGTQEVCKLTLNRTASQGALWKLVLSLADAWGVTGEFASRTLDAYGVFRLNRRTREIRLAA